MWKLVQSKIITITDFFKSTSEDEYVSHNDGVVLSRRNFLRGLGAGAVVLATPKIIIDLAPKIITDYSRIIGVQPMRVPQGIIFQLRCRRFVGDDLSEVLKEIK